MGFIYMSESCDIISMLGTLKIFFQSFFWRQWCEPVPAYLCKTERWCNMEQVCLRKKQKNYFFSELTGKTSTPYSSGFAFTLPNLEELTNIGFYIYKSILTLRICNQGRQKRKMWPLPSPPPTLFWSRGCQNSRYFVGYIAKNKK